jgi:hypothetical protein
MRSEPREALKAIYANKGSQIVRDPDLCEALLRDECAEYRKEIAVLVSAVKCGAAQELYSSAAPYDSLRARLVQQVQDDQGLTAEAASWAIDTWREALSGTLPERGPAEQVNSKPAARVKSASGVDLAGWPAAEDIARDWRSGRETENVRRAMRLLNQRVALGPQAALDLLTRHGVPTDVAEQMVLKTSRNAGKLAFGAAISCFVLSIAIWQFSSWWVHSFKSEGPLDESIYVIAFILFAVGALVWGIHERRKWRTWAMGIAARKTGAEQGS